MVPSSVVFKINFFDRSNVLASNLNGRKMDCDFINQLAKECPRIKKLIEESEVLIKRVKMTAIREEAAIRSTLANKIQAILDEEEPPENGLAVTHEDKSKSLGGQEVTTVGKESRNGTTSNNKSASRGTKRKHKEGVVSGVQPQKEHQEVSRPQKTTTTLASTSFETFDGIPLTITDDLDATIYGFSAAATYGEDAPPNCYKPVKPEWMTDGLYEQATRSTIHEKSNEVINCKSCSKQFKGFRQGKNVIIEFAYYLHCIEECEPFKVNGHIQCCSFCPMKFVSRQGMLSHLSSHRKDEISNISAPVALEQIEFKDEIDKSIIEEQIITEEQQRSPPEDSSSSSFNSSSSYTPSNNTIRPPKPDWMPTTTYRNSLISTLVNSKKMVGCKGCQRRFRTCDTGHGGHEFAFYIHCIEECEAFRNLGLIRPCLKCNLKFLTPTALGNHHCVNKDASNPSEPIDESAGQQADSLDLVSN